MSSLGSPLRYPGGKAKLADLLQQIREINHLGAKELAEPFAGGAGASLSLLFREETRAIWINDRDPAIHDFWWSVTERPRQFLALFDDTPVTIEEWRHQREVYRTQGRVARLRRGFAAFYLNRTNRSGILLGGGPVGGLEQQGAWKLDARYSRKGLRARLENVIEYANRITVSDLDGIEFVRQLEPERVMAFIDPPYYSKGKTLYLNVPDGGYHRRLAEELRHREDWPWILTYDDCPEIREMYEPWANVRPFGLRYAASERRQGRELLIAPRWMRLPVSQSSRAIDW